MLWTFLAIPSIPFNRTNKTFSFPTFLMYINNYFVVIYSKCKLIFGWELISVTMRIIFPGIHFKQIVASGDYVYWLKVGWVIWLLTALCLFITDSINVLRNSLIDLEICRNCFMHEFIIIPRNLVLNIFYEWQLKDQS